MSHRLITFLISLLFCASSFAQTNTILATASPKLKKFISNHPDAGKMLETAFSTAFSNRTSRLFYFYSNTESEARAFHYYPNTADFAEVVICVRENQNVFDEFITLFFEILNSRNESGFTKLFDEAYQGTISKKQFAEGILKYEFEATKDVQSALLTLKLDKQETDKAYYYRKFIECPSDFKDFLSYTRKVSTQRDPLKEYELRYEALRKAFRDAGTPPASPSKK